MMFHNLPIFVNPVLIQTPGVLVSSGVKEDPDDWNESGSGNGSDGYDTCIDDSSGGENFIQIFIVLCAYIQF